MSTAIDASTAACLLNSFHCGVPLPTLYNLQKFHTFFIGPSLSIPFNFHPVGQAKSSLEMRRETAEVWPMRTSNLPG
jgi:hypothetical protein